jgi:hypothetical protein
MDPMFCEGLGARIGLEICEPLTQSDSKLSTISQIYKTFMGEARAINGIEQGPVEPRWTIIWRQVVAGGDRQLQPDLVPRG